MDGATCIAENQDVLCGNVVAAREALTLQIHYRLHLHLVDVNDAHVACVREDKDVTRKSLDCSHGQAFNRVRLIAGLWWQMEFICSITQVC